MVNLDWVLIRDTLSFAANIQEYLVFPVDLLAKMRDDAEPLSLPPYRHKEARRRLPVSKGMQTARSVIFLHSDRCDDW